MNGIPILGALPNSPAEECGLRYGDVLLSVNGQAMSSVEDFLTARSAATGMMDLLVRRGDHVFELSIDISRTKPRQKGSAVAAVKQMSQLAAFPMPCRKDTPN